MLRVLKLLLLLPPLLLLLLNKTSFLPPSGTVETLIIDKSLKAKHDKLLNMAPGRFGNTKLTLQRLPRRDEEVLGVVLKMTYLVSASTSAKFVSKIVKPCALAARLEAIAHFVVSFPTREHPVAESNVGCCAIVTPFLLSNDFKKFPD